MYLFVKHVLCIETIIINDAISAKWKLSFFKKKKLLYELRNGLPDKLPFSFFF